VGFDGSEVTAAVAEPHYNSPPGGTAEKIVTEPADDYVADFVKGISRLKLVFAHTIMQPIEEYQATNGEDLEGCPMAHEDSDLDSLIDLAVEADRPIVVTEDGKRVGVVTRQALLRGIQGG